MAEPLSLPRVVLVTGTGTEIGKTVVTAALAATVLARGSSVAVVKPAQTGLAPGEPGDVDAVARLVGRPGDGSDPRFLTRELVRLPEPLAPTTAARRAGVELDPVARVARTVTEVADTVDVVLVEGAGGLLVGLDGRGATLADLGTALRYKGTSTGAVLVVAAGLGTLNHTALTAEALRHREIPLLGTVIGSWPQDPDLAEQTNLQDLPVAAGAPLLGRVPAGSGGLAADAFTAAAPGWLDGL